MNLSKIAISCIYSYNLGLVVLSRLVDNLLIWIFNLKLLIMKYELPINYNELHYSERKFVRQQYIEEQQGKCYYCGEDLNKPAPRRITNKLINWDLFPNNFLQYPIHLQHNHKTGMTEGVVHNYCNAVMWQYEGK